MLAGIVAAAFVTATAANKNKIDSDVHANPWFLRRLYIVEAGIAGRMKYLTSSPDGAAMLDAAALTLAVEKYELSVPRMVTEHSLALQLFKGVLPRAVGR